VRTIGPADLEAMLVDAIRAWDTDPETHEVLLEMLAALAGDGAPVLAAATRRLESALDTLWRRGWTPVDVVHVTSHRLTGAHARVIRRAAVADGQRRARSGAPPHDRWRAQLEAWPADLARAAAHDTDLRLLVPVLALLSRLPEIPAVMPGPHDADRTGAGATAHVDQRTLARVRALLAKAESTEFDEEAEALTAKAQELITRHAIADALANGPDDGGEPSVRRVPIDGSYKDAKASLLAVVADANRCQAVHSPDLGWVTLFGYDGDLDAVELLATSLLTQATNAIARHGPRRGRDGRSTTRSFRRAFLFGFATRIGERLRAAADTQVAATGAAQARLLPVLAARDDRVRAAATQTFPQLERRTTRISNPTGWSAGRAAADLADLGASAS
jgi:hypothetical protein